jgi:hypothetical protein
VDELDPSDVEQTLSEWSGSILGRFALGEPVSEADLYEAVAFSWISSRQTYEEVFSPHNHRIVELLISP